MAGSAHQGRRLAILRGLLSKMSDEQRLQCTSKLCQEVLAAVPDGTLALDPATKQQPVLADALALLASRETKAPPAPTRTATTTTTAPPAAAASRGGERGARQAAHPGGAGRRLSSRSCRS